MADIKISQLSSVSEVQASNIVPVVSGAATMSATAAQLKTYVTKDLDVSDSPVTGSYVTAVSEANGSISVTREAADATPTESSAKMVKSGGVYTALSSKAEKSTISDAYNAIKAYAVGDHFIHNDVIYTVKVACTGITPPNANYYTANNLTDLIEANSSQISDLSDTVTTAFSGMTFLSSGSLTLAELLALPTGIYQNRGMSADCLPSTYGSLIVFKNGYYRDFIFFDGNTMYFAHAVRTDTSITWHLLTNTT